jgi:hypothetical protein
MAKLRKQYTFKREKYTVHVIIMGMNSANAEGHCFVVIIGSVHGLVTRKQAALAENNGQVPANTALSSDRRHNNGRNTAHLTSKSGKDPRRGCIPRKTGSVVGGK